MQLCQSNTKTQRSFGAAILFVSAFILGTTISTTSYAQDESLIEEVVVTGSYIKGTPEDAELPVDVFSRSDLEDVGSPSINEFIRNLNVSSGALAETNQFDTRGGQANEGVSTVNLRGLGSSRTLVLINSKRQVATENLGVDISTIPNIAIQRVEILKEGAAATYGSDAIGGVVNFIMRSGFEGLEVRGAFQNIDDSDGNSDFGVIWGSSNDQFSWLLAGEYAERSELRIRDRDWALRPYAENPAPGGYSSIGNPGTILPAVSDANGQPTTNAFQLGLLADPNCAELGGTVAGGFCRFQYTFFDNLIEDEESIRLFGEINADINDEMTFHAEALWHQMEMPEWKTSPSYPPQALTGADRFIAPTHPGLVSLKAQNPTLFSDVDLNDDGVIDVLGAELGAYSWSRMLGVAGRNGQPESRTRETETKRLSASLVGTFSEGVGYDVSVTWSEHQRDITGSDMFIERMAFAFDGLGGPNCNPATGTPGVGECQYYNPFSNAIPFSAVTGLANPNYDASVANSDELINWLTAFTGSFTTNEQLVLEAIFNGETDWELGGGIVGWAAGAQWRQDDYEFRVLPVANRAINPCPYNNPASVTLGHTTTLDCGSGGAGQLAFLAATDEETTDRSIYAAFTEFSLPISDVLDAQLAFRYEDYGDDGGSSFDPKLAVRWSATEELSFRGSVSTTFRGPPASALGGTSTALTFVTPALAFKAADTTGNPSLQPEEATAINLGVIYQTDALYGSIDYWSFDFSDPIQLESVNQIVAAYGAANCEDGGAGVGSSTCDLLRARLTPTGTSVAGVQRIQRFWINGADVVTSGVDYKVNYTFEGVAQGSLDLGLEGTYQLEYESDDFVSRDGLLLATGGDFVGRSNESTPFTPLPEFKNNFFVRWGNDEHRVNWTARWVSGYDDFAPDTPDALRKIDDYLTHDITYVNNMVEKLTATVSIFNALDEDPPQVANDLNYDPYNHSPFGRMIKVSLEYAIF